MSSQRQRTAGTTRAGSGRRFGALLVALAVLASAAQARDPAASLLGRWTLDDALTRAVQPQQAQRKSGFGNLRMPTVSVNGIPLPGSSAAPPPVTGSAVDPKVLRCTAMTIEPVGDDLLLTYAGEGSEQLATGKVQGVRTRWKPARAPMRLTSSYETTTRKVGKTFELRDDGTLLVTVKLDPNDGPAVLHRRVFRRAD
ncbi:MAG: hypothetical protein R3E86_12420 [Pseudomonadales bacterium]